MPEILYPLYLKGSGFINTGLLVFREWLEANKNRWLCQKACAGVRSRKVGKPRLQLYNNTTARPRARGPCPPRSGVSGYDHTTTGCCYPFRITRPSVVRSLLVPASEMGMEQAMLYPTLFVPLFVPLVLWRGAVCTPGLDRVEYFEAAHLGAPAWRPIGHLSRRRGTNGLC